MLVGVEASHDVVRVLAGSVFGGAVYAAILWRFSFLSLMQRTISAATRAARRGVRGSASDGSSRPCTHDAPRRSNAPRTAALVSPYRLRRGRWDPARQRSALSRHGRPPQALGARTRSDASARVITMALGGTILGLWLREVVEAALEVLRHPLRRPGPSPITRRRCEDLPVGLPARATNVGGRCHASQARPAKRRQRPDLAVNHGERARRRSGARAHGARRVSSVARAHSGAGPGRVACRPCATHRPLCRSWCS